MRKLVKKLARGEGGFTLIELVVVIAILGVLAAIATPLIVNYLTQAKERAYNSDVKQVQAAVDAYYSAPDNNKFTGKRQYPILGMDVGSSVQAELLADDDLNSLDVTLVDVVGADPAIPHKNPLGGSAGGDPVWVDDGDGIRSGVDGTEEENLNGPAVDATVPGWFMVEAVRQTKTYYVDTRDFIIDMEELVTAGLLAEVPASAAADNCQALTCDGSYIYYVDADGKVKTLLATFPVLALDESGKKIGFQGVFP